MAGRVHLTAVLVWLALLSAPACRRASDGAPPRATAVAQRYQLTGQVISVDASHQRLTIKHERIVGYMAGMTMSFHVPDRAAVRAAEPGSHVDATLVVDGDRSWLEEIALVSGHADRGLEGADRGARSGRKSIVR